MFRQPTIKVYLFPGEGSDERIFSKLKLAPHFQILPVHFPIPGKGNSMEEYAAIISKQIDTTGTYVFISVSLGGMICTELADMLNPSKIIIISSAKCRNELPALYRFMSVIPINKIVPAGVIKFGAKVLQPVVEPDRNKNKATFKSMMENKNKTFIKRTVNMIINWKRQTYSNKIIHIHGSNDHTLPLKNIQADYIIKEGSHMMTLTRGDELNDLIISILSEK